MPNLYKLSDNLRLASIVRSGLVLAAEIFPDLDGAALEAAIAFTPDKFAVF